MKITICKYFVLLFLVILFPFISINFVKAQTQSDKNFDLNDSTKTNNREEKESFFEKVVDYVEFRNEADREDDSTRFRSKFVISPIVSYKPSTSWGFGVGAKWLFKFKNSTQDTRTSNMPISAIYTLKNQIVIGSGYVVFFNRETFMVKGNIQYSKFPQLYYGIGGTTSKENEELYEYQNFLFEPLLLKRVVGKLFLGGGIRYRNIWNLKSQRDGLLEQQKPLGYRGSVSSGLQLAATFDNRDNVLNAQTGSLYEIKHAFYGRKLAGFPFQSTQIDLRSYFKLSQRNDIVAIQGYGFFSDGRAPVNELAALGGSDLMRGYYQGRFLDNNMLATQLEYRFPVYEPIGIVVFVGAGNVYNKISELRLNALKIGYGAGLRLKIVRSENLNIRVDVAKGEKLNFYFGIAEAF